MKSAARAASWVSRSRSSRVKPSARGLIASSAPIPARPSRSGTQATDALRSAVIWWAICPVRVTCATSASISCGTSWPGWVGYSARRRIDIARLAQEERAIGGRGAGESVHQHQAQQRAHIGRGQRVAVEGLEEGQGAALRPAARPGLRDQHQRGNACRRLLQQFQRRRPEDPDARTTDHQRAQYRLAHRQAGSRPGCPMGRWPGPL